jgi:hypothetical protein
MKLSHSILGSTFLFLYACGGGGGTPTDVGVFVDAPVEGLAYESGGITGTTDSAGKFTYVVGQNVSFSVSGVTLPAVLGASLLTPVDLVGASSPDSPESVYIARFLQSIDSDGNPDNGIRIDKSKLKTGAATPANWNTDPLANLVSDAALAAAPTEAAARTHMKTQIAALSGLPRMSLVGRYSAKGTAGKSARLYAEIISYHKLSKSAFITIDDSSTSNLTSFARISLSALPTTGMKTKSDDNNETVSTQNLPLGTIVNVATDVNIGGFIAGGVQSLDITGNLLAIAVANTTKGSNGVIAFYTLDASGAATFVRKVEVGALPDGVAFSPNGRYLVVANEGEPDATKGVVSSDAEGSISIIAITDGLPATSATPLGFTDFNTGGSRASELPAGVRKVRPDPTTFSKDVEPEYVTITDDSKTAFVTLQEANAVAVVDLATSRISKIHALGVKDFGQPKNKIWTNDSYSGCNDDTVCPPPTLKNYTNLFGYYMPDGVASFTIAGKTYFLTGNEGDDKNDNIETAAKETALVSAISLDTAVFPTSVSTELANLTINKTANGSAVGVNSTTGKYEKLYTYGARSFSIWDADTGAQVFDSGDDFERVVYNDATPLLLNNSEGLRKRMDNKGPEPENLVVGQIGKEYYAFIGLERSSGIMMYQITNPAKPKFVQYIRNTTNPASTDSNIAGDISPEGLKFISAADSPTGVPLLMVGYEVTGSLAVFQIK